MEKEFLNIDELSQYLGVKKSNLYSKVERKEIPFYKWGRLIMFKKDEIDDFMKLCRVECFNIKKESKRILRGANRSEVDINKVVKKAIDQGRGKAYTPDHGKPDQIKGLRKGARNGTV